MAFKIAGDTSGNVAEVTTDKELRTIGSTATDGAGNPAIAGYSNSIFEQDAGSVIGTPTQKQGDISANYRQRIGMDTLLFNDQFNGSALNTGIWNTNLTTFTTSVAGGFLTLNASSLTTANAVARVQTYRGFPAYGSYPLQLEVEAIYAAVGPNIPNTVTEIGFGFATGVVAPTDGAFFRWNAAGEFRTVICFNGVESQSAAFSPGFVPSENVRHHYVVVVGNDYVEFWVDNVLYANQVVPGGNAMALLNQNTPVLIRHYNAATPPASAVQIKVANVGISLGDMNSTKPWSHIQTGMMGHASQGQTGMTMGSTANFANSANPTAAVPTNTTAALGVGLGGQFWETDTLAVNTDGIICSFQVPAASASSPSKTLYITRITFSSFVQTALTGGPYVAVWSLAYGHTAVSLATAESATTKAPRRLPLSVQAVTAAQAVGTLVGQHFDFDFDSPIVVQPGEFVAMVKKKVGTAPSAGVIAHQISFGGYWE
jgi:hypothetical protein